MMMTTSRVRAAFSTFCEAAFEWQLLLSLTTANKFLLHHNHLTFSPTLSCFLPNERSFPIQDTPTSMKFSLTLLALVAGAQCNSWFGNAGKLYVSNPVLPWRMDTLPRSDLRLTDTEAE